MAAAYSWLRRSVSKLKKTSLPSDVGGEKGKVEEPEKVSYGVNEQLIQLIKTFSVETFRNFSLSETGDGDDSGKDLSDWQETHAKLVLSAVEELAQLRFQLCPRYLKERQFWRIYFTLVRSCVSKYEVRAVQLAKLKQMSMEGESFTNNTVYEVEMSEAKSPTMSMDPPIQKEKTARSHGPKQLKTL